MAQTASFALIVKVKAFFFCVCASGTERKPEKAAGSTGETAEHQSGQAARADPTEGAGRGEETSGGGNSKVQLSIRFRFNATVKVLLLNSVEK